MGFWSSIGSAISSGISSAVQAPGQNQREKHGFSGFDADMERLRNFDPSAELDKLEAAAGAQPPSQPTTKPPAK